MSDLFDLDDNGTVSYLGEPPKNLQEAFDIEIQKWQYIASNPYIEDDGRTETCGLCMLYNNEETVERCEGCPVYERAGFYSCVGSPYSEVAEAILASDFQAVRRAAGKWIRFLTELKKVTLKHVRPV